MKKLWPGSALAFFLTAGFFLPGPVQAETTHPYKEIGDGKPATKVILTLIDGIASDADGNIYISHRSMNRIRKITPDGIITTIAGNGRAGFSGDGGPALDASLNFPAGLTVDGKGNLFIADRNNHRVRKIDSSGIITTVAGSGLADFGGDEEPAVEANLNFPSDVAFDSSGNLYISDRSNNRIRKVDSQGIITTVAGLGAPGFGGDFGLAEDAFLKYPFGLFIDNKGNMFIADRGNNRVRKVDTRGIITTVAGDSMHSFSGDYGPSNQSSLAYPTDVVVDDEGNIYICDRNNNRIRKVDTLGVITTFMGTGTVDYNGDNEIAAETNLHLPFAMAIHRGKQLLVVDRNHFRVRSVDLAGKTVKSVAGSGKSLFKGDGGPGTGATLGFPSGIVVDSMGNVLFADKQHNRIRKIDKAGRISTFAGTGKLGNEGNGGPALNAALYLPSDLAIDREDNIYVATRVGHGWVVRKIDAQGIIHAFAGNGRQGNDGDGGPATKASFHTISDIATDKRGNVYISDLINQNIRKVDKNGIISTAIPKNILADAAEVHINGLIVEEDGSIVFSDSGSSKIRKIDAQGKISDIAGTGDFSDSGDDGPALAAGIRSPGGLTLDSDGALYVLEEQSHRIRKIGRDGIITLVAGEGTQGFSGDGGPARDARLNKPNRMAIDAAGNLVFSDRDNLRIRKIDKNGIITTLAGHGNIGWLQDGFEVRIAIQNFP